jgi:hypothetical protein
MIYTHVLKVGGAGVRSPLDAMCAANPVPATPLLHCREPAARYATLH